MFAKERNPAPIDIECQSWKLGSGEETCRDSQAPCSGFKQKNNENSPLSSRKIEYIYIYNYMWRFNEFYICIMNQVFCKTTPSCFNLLNLFLRRHRPWRSGRDTLRFPSVRSVPEDLCSLGEELLLGRTYQHLVGIGGGLKEGLTWRIIPLSKWLITMVIVSPLTGD